MKKLTIFLFVTFFCRTLQPVNAQTVPSLKKVKSMQDNVILNLGVCNWAATPDQIETTPLKSREFGFLMMSQRMIASGIFGIGFGPGFSSQNVHHNAQLNTEPGGPYTYLSPLPDSVDYSLNKLSLNFLDAQIELRLHSKARDNKPVFKLSAGLKGGILLQSHSKYKDNHSTYKRSGIPDLNKFQYGIVSRVGYGRVAVGVYYSLTGIFKEEKGPELIPYSVSLQFTM